MSPALVALVGRPNVGKSTLFNRLTGVRTAIVEDLPGTTRDRLYGTAEWQGQQFGLVDTGGLRFRDPGATAVRSRSANSSEEFSLSILEQATVALDEADAVILLTDVKDGVVAEDLDVATFLRQHDKPVVLAVNKAETDARVLDAAEFWQLGLGEPMAISALHGDGVAELLDNLLPTLAGGPVRDDEDDSVHIALVGRPNVGKSSLLNALMGEERAITSDVPGTTRDPVDSRLTWHGRDVTLVDTAGIRRRGRVERGIEQYSVLRSARAIDRADVALLLLDATEGVTAQDAHVAGMIEESKTGVILLANKWDAVAKDERTILEYEKKIRSDLRFLPYAPLLFISALDRQRLHRILPTALEVQAARTQRIGTGPFNQLIQQAYFNGATPSRNGQPLRIYYGTQVAVAPPTFVLFVNNSKLVHFTYARYIENAIREQHPFTGTPIRVEFRTRS